MKTQNQKISKICFVAALCILATNIQLFAQGNNWKLNLNNNVDTGDGVGTLNYADLNFFTFNKKRFIITKDGIIRVSGIMKGFTNSVVIDWIKDEIRSDNPTPILKFGGDDGFNNFLSNIKIGIGTQSPAFTLHLAGDGVNTNGGILSAGELATLANPVLGQLLPSGLTGPRFIWYPGLAALRAGESLTPNWESSNIGFHSVAFGLNTKASGPNSFAMGEETVASGEHSVAFGHLSQATAHGAFAAGPLAQAPLR